MWRGRRRGLRGVLLDCIWAFGKLMRCSTCERCGGNFLVMGGSGAGFHVLVNVAMVIGVLAVTGIHSSNELRGSATLFVFLAIGLVMNVRLRASSTDEPQCA